MPVPAMPFALDPVVSPAIPLDVVCKALCNVSVKVMVVDRRLRFHEP